MIEVHAVSYGNLGSCHAGTSTVAAEREERRERYR